jgi:hypothetical protein
VRGEKGKVADMGVRGIGFCHEHALILYVYLPNDDTEDSVLTVSDLLVERRAC